MPSGDIAKRHADELKTIFTDDPRFEFIKLISYGSNGSVSQVRFNDQSCPYFVVKRAFRENESLSRERQILEVYNFETKIH